ncbi:MAG: DnaJ domain-containing protein, partial [Bradymonadaceae bacterium]
MEGLRRLAEFGLIEIPGFEVDDEPEESPSGQSEPDEIPQASVVSESSEASDVSEVSSVGENDSTPIAREASDVERAGADVSSSPRSASEGSQAASTEETGSTRGSASVGIDLSHLPVPPADFAYDDEMLEMDVPLSEELKRELLVLDEQVDELTHYQFFDIDRDADRGEIKKSYFKLSKRYHPDKHFRKEIGPYKNKLENVFQKITRAYRVLSDPDQREEYDRELAQRTRNPNDSNATGLSKPSQMHMASESASFRSDQGDDSGKDKRSAAFAHLV